MTVDWGFVNHTAPGAERRWPTRLDENDFVIGVTRKPLRAVARYRRCFGPHPRPPCECRDFVDGHWTLITHRELEHRG